MRISIIAAIFRKDVVDAVRDSRVLVSLLTPIVLAILYNSIFPEERVVEVKVAFAGPENSALVRSVEDRAGQTVSLKLRHVDSDVEARHLVVTQGVDAAFVLPADVDDAIRQGRRPTITLIQPAEGSSAANFVSAALETGIRALSGQPPIATVAVERVQAGSAEAGVLGELGARRYFVLATVVMMLGMIAVLAVPIILTEEAEKKTLDALLLVANYREVIIGKALVGLAYSAASVALMLALTRLRPIDIPTFVMGTALLAVSLIGLGLLLGGVFKSAAQVYTWSSVLLLPIIGPAFVAGLPVPDALDIALRAFPTFQGMRVMTNGLAGKPLFTDIWISYAVLLAWVAIAYGALAWRLGRRES
ncbi:MAG TPA: ABC transporter permease [Candidatus Limnocylindria bacterium]|jgi:ABC-2 type transport system permease protein